MNVMKIMKVIKSLGPIFIMLFILIHLLSKHEKKINEQIVQYLTVKRNQLLQKYYPGCSFYYQDNITAQKNFLTMINMDHHKYAFHLEKNYPLSTISVTHKIKLHSRGDSDSSDEYGEYFLLNAVPNQKEHFPLHGTFRATDAHYLVPLKGPLSKFFDKVLDSSDPSVSGDIRFKTSGSFSYHNIPPQDWECFSSTRALEFIEQLCSLWHRTAGSIALHYDNGNLLLTVERAHKSSGDPSPWHSNPTRFLAENDDFLVQNASLFNETMDLLNAITEQML